MIGGVLMKKNKKFDDNIVEILLGTTLICINKFNDGILIEKILVLSGFILLITGIIRTFIKYYQCYRKAMVGFLVIIVLISIITFLGLLYRLILG